MKDWDFFEKVSKKKAERGLEGPLPAGYYQLLYAEVSQGKVDFSQIKNGFVSPPPPHYSAHASKFSS